MRETNEIVSSGRALATRRDVLRAGAAGLITLVGLGTVLKGKIYAEEPALAESTPALEEGPFWIEEADQRYRRSDLRANLDGTSMQAGLPLNLWLTVSELQNGAIAPLQSAFVYIWIANALGVYSGEQGERTLSDSYLRGYQVTDEKGIVAFTANYPGWYDGRTVHIHARVRTYPGNDSTQKPLTDFETQLFFDDGVTDHVMANVAPYNTRNRRDTTNKTDRVYNGPALDVAPGASTAAAMPTGDLTKVKVVSAATHANASFHMVLDTSRHARPPIPPGGFGSRRPSTIGGPPPMGSNGAMPPPPDGFGGGDGPPPNG